jgi:formate hydrogenlyase subunit 3/multisubunit Na+/H+ antiporter MnhD subunit
MACLLAILIVSSFAYLLSLLFKSSYTAGVFTMWIRRLTRVAQFGWLSVAVFAIKESSKNKECRSETKTNNLLLLILVCAIVCTLLVTFEFMRELIALVEICVQAHSRKHQSSSTRFERLKSWFASRETASNDSYCFQCKEQFSDSCEVVELRCQ